VEISAQPGGARALLRDDLPSGALGLAWLGQAGFALRLARHRWLIDPYLSDFLARKYAGTEFPHQRMMPPPVTADELRGLELVLCSHRHSDHTDPVSLPILAANNPGCRFVVPRAELGQIRQLGLDESRLVAADSGDVVRVNDRAVVHVIPSAHETLKVNELGEHHFLGFILKLAAFTLYHSGDCVVYDGLVDRLREWKIDVALLPVNGRSERLSARGIMGNMNFDEAAALCRHAGIGTMIPHHFGMFAFNTVDPAELERKIARLGPGLQCLLPSVQKYFVFRPGGRDRRNIKY
jgi:L-ascorbate metabolism protein UlaG (beta-lactamase superfamily)